MIGNGCSEDDTYEFHIEACCLHSVTSVEKGDLKEQAFGTAPSDSCNQSQRTLFIIIYTTCFKRPTKWDVQAFVNQWTVQ